MPRNDEHYKELDCVDMERLAKAAADTDRWGVGEERYCFYRRKGHSPADALAYALAWCRNISEQAARRKSHDTGYFTGWAA